MIRVLDIFRIDLISIFVIFFCFNASLICYSQEGFGGDSEYIDFADKEGWVINYKFGPPPVVTKIIIPKGPVSQEDIEVITNCKDLESLSLNISVEDLHKLKTLPKLQSLHLFNVDFTGNEIGKLDTFEKLTRLEIADCKLNEKSLKELRTLRNISSLGINPQYLMGKHAKQVLKMPSLQKIILSKGTLSELSDEERLELTETLKGFEIVNFLGGPIDPNTLSETRGRYSFMTSNYTLFRYYLGYFFTRVFAGIMLFTIILTLLILFKKENDRWFSRFLLKVKNNHRRIVRLALITNLICFIIIIVLLAPRPKFPANVSGDYFWEAHNIADKQALTDNHVSSSHSLIITDDGYHLYIDAVDPGHPWRGSTLFAAPESDVIDLFRLNLNDKLKTPDAFSDMQLSALLERKIENREEALEDLRTGVIAYSRDIGRMREYLNTTEWERLSVVVGIAGASALKARLQAESMFEDWKKRKRVFWITIIFEIIYFSVLLLFFWLPLMLSRPRRFIPICWSVIPVYVIVPYQLGYCWLCFSPFKGLLQGVLYPFLLDFYKPVLSFTFFNVPFLNYKLPLLEFLNQPSLSPGMWLQSAITLTLPFILSLSIYFICFFILKKKLNKA